MLYTHPRPSGPHALAAAHLGMDLGGPFDRGRGGPGGWIILDEPELHFGEDIVVPDLAGWRHERMPAVPNEPFFTLVPDWVCEVIDRTEKMHIYAREGVAHAWLVDPIARTLEAFRLSRKAPARAKTKRKPRSTRPREWILVDVWREKAKVRAEPFDAVALSLESLWS